MGSLEPMIYTANRQIVQSRTLESRISRSTIYSLRGDPGKHLSTGVDKPHISRESTSPSFRGASTSASPTLPRHVR